MAYLEPILSWIPHGVVISDCKLIISSNNLGQIVKKRASLTTQFIAIQLYSGTLFHQLMALFSECKVSNDCILDVQCMSDKNQCSYYGESHKCRGSCNKYAVCNYGQFWVRSCPFDWSYHPQLHTCTSGKRCMNAPQTKSIAQRQTRPAWNATQRQKPYLQNYRQIGFGSGKFGDTFG